MSRGEPHERPLDPSWTPGPTPKGARALPEPVALVDLDGTLADFDGAMKAALDTLRGPHDDPKHDETAYEDLPHMKARRRLIKRLPGFWRGLATLDRDMRTDDVEVVLNALRMVKFVGSVEPLVADVSDHVARARVRTELEGDLHDAIRRVFALNKLATRKDGE